LKSKRMMGARQGQTTKKKNTWKRGKSSCKWGDARKGLGGSGTQKQVWGHLPREIVKNNDRFGGKGTYQKDGGVEKERGRPALGKKKKEIKQGKRIWDQKSKKNKKQAWGRQGEVKHKRSYKRGKLFAGREPKVDPNQALP